MADSGFADPSERLPWLAGPEPRKPQTRRSSLPLLALLLAAAAVAFGAWTLTDRAKPPAPVVRPPDQTIALPPPTAIPESQALPQAATPAEREALRPTVERPVPEKAAAKPRPKRKPAATAPARRQATPAAARPAYNARAWNSGVRGRIIQLGAFRTRAQADAQWKRIYYRYPLLRPLPPRVVKTKIRGRTYYRLHLGTFSHAHSELLCQRLRATGEGCIVLGLRGRR